MAQYDLWALRDGTVVVDVQSDLLDVFDTRVVIPLLVPDTDAMTSARLNPSLTVDGEPRFIATQLIGAVRRSDLNKRIGSLAGESDRIVAAIDMMIGGV